jgi:hypothetical protein
VGRGAEKDDTDEEEEDEEREANKIAEMILAEEQLENRLRYFSCLSSC